MNPKAREVVIRCTGNPRPGVVWVEFVFVEWNAGGFSVYERVREKRLRIVPVPRLLATVSEPLTFRQVLKALRRFGEASLPRDFRGKVRVHGVEPWQENVIARMMMRHWQLSRFLNVQSVRDLKTLHEVLGDLLSEEATHVLAVLNSATAADDFCRKSLKRVAKTVGVPDHRDLQRVIEKAEAWRTDRAAQSALLAASPEALLALLNRKPLASDSLRAELLELWMRLDRKPRGGPMFAGFCFSGSEFPFLRWLLAGHVRAVFSDLMGRRPAELEQFVLWLLQEAHYYASCFSADYRFGSFNEFTFGRPLFRACAQLGLEVEKAALAMGIAVPDDVRLPAMPALDNGGWSILLPRSKATTQLIETLIQNP